MKTIADQTRLDAVCASLARADFLTVDTEFMRENTFWPKLCLIQVASADELALVDALAPGLDLQPLLALLTRPGLPKIMHGARQDIEIFHHLGGQIPAPLYDTQIAAMVCGFGDQVSFEALVTKLTGHRPDKASRFTDWSVRPLTARQLRYAAGDVLYLRDAWLALRRELDASGRAAWLEDDHARLTDPATYRIVPGEAWQRLKVRSRDRRYLAVLRAAAAWREEEAMARDVPRNRILRDEVLSEIAAHPPGEAADLMRMRGVGKGFAGGAAGRSLLRRIAAALAAPAESWPEAPPPQPHGNGPGAELLRVLLKHCCEQHGVARKLVAGTRELEQIAAGRTDLPALRGWRFDLFGQAALELCRGRAALSLRNGKLHVQALPESPAGPADGLDQQPR